MSRRINEVAVAVLLGALAVGILIAVVKLVATNDHTAPSVTVVAPDQDEPVDPAGFLADYERSLVGPYVARGSVTVRDAGVAVASTRYKSVRRGEQGFEQEGTAIVMVDNGSQATCDQLPSSNETTCGPTVDALTTAELVDKAQRLLKPQGETERAPLRRSTPTTMAAGSGRNPAIVGWRMGSNRHLVLRFVDGRDHAPRDNNGHTNYRANRRFG
ncbi:MAG: hypothetical protein R2706_06700 [Acidimicrobiales bacterium]